MASSSTRYAGGAVTTLLAAARFAATCVHAGAHGTGPNADLVRETLYHELPEAYRARLHLTIAQALEQGRFTPTSTLGATRSALRIFGHQSSR
jgi:hypothetical protein